MNTVLRLLKTRETREKIVFTLMILVAYRVGFHIPLPGMNAAALREQVGGNTGVFGLLSAFSGGQIGKTVIFSLGIMPYISASIIFSVLGKVSPQLEAISKEGASGQKKINQWTRLSVVPISLLQAVMVWFGVFKKSGLLNDTSVGFMLMVVLGLMAGAMLVMWLGELITEYGIGNGASLIIMANIISTIPASLANVVAQQDEAYNTILTLVGIWIGIVLVIVYIQKGERRIPIQYARLTRGRKVYGGQRHFLPLKINMAGVMPIIFASALFMVPGVIFEALGWNTVSSLFQDTDGFVYVSLYLVLVFGFCFFWNNLMFQPEEIADNLREHGSFIPGIRPGARTAAYLKGVLTRITLAGAAFLALIAVIPNFITGNIPGLTGSLAYFLGGTSVLIVVGVAMDMVDRLNASLSMSSYEAAAGGKEAGNNSGGAGWAKR